MIKLKGLSHKCLFFLGRDFDGEIPKERTNSIRKKEKKRFFKYFRKSFPRLNPKPLLKEGFFNENFSTVLYI